MLYIWQRVVKLLSAAALSVFELSAAALSVLELSAAALSAFVLLFEDAGVFFKQQSD